MRKLLSLLFVLASFLPLQSCRETVPPETLEDSETSKEDSIDVNLGRYNDES